MNRNTSILYRAVDAFFRYRSLFLLSVVLVAVGPMAYIYTHKVQYSASAQTQCDPNGLPQGLAHLTDIPGSANTYQTVAQQNLNRFNEWVQDDSPGGFLDRAMQRAELPHPIKVDPRLKDPQMAALIKGLKPASDSDTVFSISLTWGNPWECEKIVKAFQAEYIDEVGNTRQAESKSTNTFLDHELTRYQDKMQRAETVLINYKQGHQGQSPESQSATMTQMSYLKTQLDDLQITSRNSELKRKVIADQIKRIKPTSILEKHIADSPIMAQIKDLQGKRSTLIVEGWLPTSDRVHAIDSQIDRLKLQLKAESASDAASNVTELVLQDNPEYQKLTQDLAQTTIDSSTQAAQMDLLRQQIKQYESAIAQIPSAEAMLNNATRDYTILKAQYEKLQERKQQSEINMNLDKVAATSTLRPIGIVYAQPTTTRTKKALMLGGLLIFSILVGVGVTMVAEWADPSLRNANDMENRLGIPVLVTLPEAADVRGASARARLRSRPEQRLLTARETD